MRSGTTLRTLSGRRPSRQQVILPPNQPLPDGRSGNILPQRQAPHRDRAGRTRARRSPRHRHRPMPLLRSARAFGHLPSILASPAHAFGAASSAQCFQQAQGNFIPQTPAPARGALSYQGSSDEVHIASTMRPSTAFAAAFSTCGGAGGGCIFFRDCAPLTVDVSPFARALPDILRWVRLICTPAATCARANRCCSTCLPCSPDPSDENTPACLAILALQSQPPHPHRTSGQ